MCCFSSLEGNCHTSLANIISYPIKTFSSSTLFIKVIKIIHKHDRLLRCATLFGKFYRISNALKQQRFSHKLKASAKIFERTSLANIISYPMKPFSSSALLIKVIKIIHEHDRLLRYTTLLACCKFVINRTRSHGRRKGGGQGGLGLPWILKMLRAPDCSTVSPP